MGDIKIQRTALSLLEDEATKYVKNGSRKSSLRRMFSGLRSSFRVKIRRRDSSETENERRKRSRLSFGASTNETSREDVDVPSVENRLSIESIKITNAQTAVDSLSENWKLSDVELQELYRLSFFKENNNVASTDLCTTEL